MMSQQLNFSKSTIDLLNQIHTLTQEKCRNCGACCSPEYCEMAIELSEGTLKSTGHSDLPLMGPQGCIAPPHLRPLCTLHLCTISGVGTSGDEEWDSKYFALRDELSERSFDDAR